MQVRLEELKKGDALRQKLIRLSKLSFIVEPVKKDVGDRNIKEPITKEHILERIAQCGVILGSDDIYMSEPLNTIGTYEVPLRLSKLVIHKLRVEVDTQENIDRKVRELRISQGDYSAFREQQEHRAKIVQHLMEQEQQEKPLQMEEVDKKKAKREKRQKIREEYGSVGERKRQKREEERIKQMRELAKIQSQGIIDKSIAESASETTAGDVHAERAELKKILAESKRVKRPRRLSKAKRREIAANLPK